MNIQEIKWAKFFLLVPLIYFCGTMIARSRIDGKGRIVLPKKFRETLNLREGDEVVIILKGDRLILEKAENPFKVVEEILGDLTFSRELRRIAEEEALKAVSEG